MKSFLKHFFVPHENNEHEPHAMRDAGLVAFLGLGMFVASLALLQHTLFTGTDILARVYPQALFSLANESRGKTVGDLAWSDMLAQAAQAKANDMAEKGYFAHTSPEGKTPWSFISHVGYDYRYAGENLAVNFSDSKDVNSAWLRSPSHRANILNDKFTEVGIATARGIYKEKEAVFVVQMFGTPRTETLLSQTEVPSSSLVAFSFQAVSHMFTKVVSNPQNSMTYAYIIIILILIGTSILFVAKSLVDHKYERVIIALMVVALLCLIFYVFRVFVWGSPAIA